MCEGVNLGRPNRQITALGTTQPLSANKTLVIRIKFRTCRTQLPICDSVSMLRFGKTPDVDPESSVAVESLTSSCQDSIIQAC